MPTRRNTDERQGRAGAAGTVGALPAAINAALDALDPSRVRALDMPAKSNRPRAKVWRAIRGASISGAIALLASCFGMLLFSGPPATAEAVKR